jgi:uncharacterized membrane protein YgcG
MNQIGQTFLIFAVGLAGGLVGSTLMSSPSAAPDGASAGDSGAALSAGADLGTVLDTIQADLAMLTQEVALQGNQMSSMDTRLAGVQTSQAKTRAAGGAAMDPLAGLDPGEMPSGMGFDAAVNAAIEKREADEAATRDADRTVRREERLDREMEKWTTELGLSTDQASQMKTILNDTTKARTDFFTEMRESGTMDRELMREKMTEMGDSQNEQLGNVLDATQMATYTESSANSGFGGFGGRRGGGGGTGGSSGGGRTNEF